MGSGIRVFFRILVVAAIAGLAAAAFYYYQLIDFREAVIGGAVGFSILIVLINNFSLQQHIGRFERTNRDINQFERSIAGRIKTLETRFGDAGEVKTSGKLSKSLSENKIPPYGISGGLAGDTKTGEKPAADNVIELSSRIERADKPAAGRAFKIKPSQLTKALEEGGAELYLQPVLELPSRKLRYFEAFLRLKVGDNILTAKQFLPAAKNSDQIARIDLLSLELTFKLVRGLQRQNNECPVFWNISLQTLGNKKLFDDILEQLRANQPLNRQLICEISHLTFEEMDGVQSDNLGRIRDLGFELSLDRISPDTSRDGQIERIIAGGLFSVLKIPANRLMHIGRGDIASYADYIVPLAMNENIALVASEVENEAQTVAMIDADIYLAQGDALMPARALKKEFGGSS